MWLATMPGALLFVYRAVRCLVPRPWAPHYLVNTKGSPAFVSLFFQGPFFTP